MKTPSTSDLFQINTYLMFEERSLRSRATLNRVVSNIAIEAPLAVKKLLIEHQFSIEAAKRSFC